MNARVRILKGIAAHLTTLATRIAVQFATLPIFFASWGAERTGAWFVLFAIPAYVGLVGTGFSGAGGTAALAATQAGDQQLARTHFRASWLISSAATAILALVFLFALAAIIPALPALTGQAAGDVQAALVWLAVYIFATSQMAVAEIPFRAAGRYPEHIALYNGAGIVEIAVIAAAVTLDQQFATLAAALAITRCCAALFIFAQARRFAAHMFAGSRSTLGGSARALWKPSLALMLVPLIFGLNLQGYVLVLGAGFGASLLAGFVATRTLTRLLDLFTNFAFATQFYEAGHIEGPKHAIQRRVLATMTCVSLAVAALFAGGLLVTGEWLQDLYTLGQTQFDPAIAAILLLAATLRALSAAPIAFLTGANRHAPVVVTYLVGSAGALLLSVLLSVSGQPLTVVLLPLVLAEACQLVPAMRAALTALDLTAPQFARMLVSSERGRDVTGAIRQLRRKR